jgi:hypothetical protein
MIITEMYRILIPRSVHHDTQTRKMLIAIGLKESCTYVFLCTTHTAEWWWYMEATVQLLVPRTVIFPDLAAVANLRALFGLSAYNEPHTAL